MTFTQLSKLLIQYKIKIIQRESDKKANRNRYDAIYKNKAIIRQISPTLKAGYITTKAPIKSTYTFQKVQYQTTCNGHVKLKDAIANNQLILFLEHMMSVHD